MTFWEWTTTWFFWIPCGAILFSLLAIAWLERYERDRYCPTCMSKRKSKRNSVRYWMSDHLSTLEPCEDIWHSRANKKGK